MTAFLVRFAASALFALFAGGASAQAPPSIDVVKTQATSEVIGDWLVACAPPSKGPRSCVLSQTLVSGKSNQPVGRLAIDKDQSGKLRGTLRLPVGVSLPAGVVLDLEKQTAPLSVPYEVCYRTGCLATFGVTEPLLEHLSKASKISAVAQNRAKEPLNLTFSTRGFSDAYAAYAKASH